MFKLAFFKSSSLKKDQKRLKKAGQLNTIQEFLERFRTAPQKTEYKKLKNPNEPGGFRLRKDPFRILFDIDYGNKIIIIYRIKYRKEAYK